MGTNSGEQPDNQATSQLYIVGETNSVRERFDHELGLHQDFTVETVAPEQAADTIGTNASGVIYVSRSQSRDAGSSAESDNQRTAEPVRRSIEAILTAIDPLNLECPVIFVGEDIDAEVAYQAGATDVIPLNAAEKTDIVVDRIVATVDRFEASTRDRTSGRDPRQEVQGLMGAFSTAFPDYAFVCDEKGKFLDVMTGWQTDDRHYDDEELLGRTVHDLLDADTADRIVREIQETLTAGDVRSVEYSLDHSDGVSWYRTRIAPLPESYEWGPGAVLVARDITERREREQERERGRRRFDALFNHPRSLVTLLDIDGRITEISDAAVALVDASTEEILGRQFWEGPWFEGDPTLQKRIREAVQRALDGENTRLEADLPLPDRELVIDAMLQPITDENDNITSVLGVARDITRRRRSRQIRKELLSTTQELMTVDTHEDVARVVSDATTAILDHDLNVVYLHDGDTTEAPLVPVAWSDQVEETIGDPPELTGDGPITEAYRRGEPTIYDGINDGTDRPADQYAPVESLLAVPLGDHGILAIGAVELDAFDDTDVERYRLLTVNAATALDRVEQRRDLRRYETLFETVQDKLYVLDEDGYIQMVTDPLTETLGYEADVLRGQHVSTIVTEETAKEGERLILDMLVTPDTASSTYEGRMVARDGEEIPIEVELSLLPYEDNFRGTVGAVRDISARREREQELYVFREAITEAGIGLAMYGPDGHFEYVNDHYADMLGRTRETMEGSPVWEVFEGVTGGGFDGYWNGFSAGETETSESEHRRNDGSTVPVETVTTAVEIDDTRHHILTVQDITDRRERRQQAQTLDRILRHNLRNELTVMIGHVNILAERLPAEYEETVETLTETTQDLIDLSETASEARTLFESDTRRKPVEVTDIVREEVHEIRAQYDASVELSLPERRYVRADSSLGVAVKHLLTNAVEHNDSDSPRVWVRVRNARDREDWVAIEIADDGPGIPDIERETLESGAEDQLRHGVGMGLWLVQWIVSRYGGDLTFEERDPRGSRVRIALPVATRESPDGGSQKV